MSEVIVQVLYATESEEASKEISELILKYLPKEVVHDSFHQTSEITDDPKEPEFETLFRIMVAPASVVSVLEIIEAVMTAQVDSTDLEVFAKLYDGHEIKIVSDLKSKDQALVNKDMINYLYDRVQQLQLEVNEGKVYAVRTEEDVAGINEGFMGLGTYVTEKINIRKMAEIVKALCIDSGNSEILESWLGNVEAVEH